MGELWALSESPVTVRIKEGKGRAFQGEVLAWAQAGAQSWVSGQVRPGGWNAGMIQGSGEERRQVETRWGLLPYMVSTLSPGHYHVQPAVYSLMIHLPYLPSQPALHSGGKTVLEAGGTPATMSGSEEPKGSQPWSLPLRSSLPSGGERQVSAPTWGRGYTERTPGTGRAPC